MSKRKLDYIQRDCLFNNSRNISNTNYNNFQNFENNSKMIKNINSNDYCNIQPVRKKKRTIKTNIQQIKLIVNDPSFRDYSIDDLGQLSKELGEVIQQLQSHRAHIESILNMYI